MSIQDPRPAPGISQKTPGKALYALLTEIDLGLKLYPATNHDVVVWREGQQYWLQRLDPRNGGTPLEDGKEFSPAGLSYTHLLAPDRPVSGQIIQTITMKYENFSDLLTDWPLLAWRAVCSCVHEAKSGILDTNTRCMKRFTAIL